MTLRGGFTLVEMLTVLTVIAILMGFVIATPKGDERDAQVKGAAQELAAVLRSARTMAMEARGMYAVSFNIQNPPGSNGRVLSNRSGGHWYRIIGPRNENLGNLAMPGSGFPPLYSRDESSLNGASCRWGRGWSDSPVRHQLEAVERAWVGDRRQLPVGKVRFLALNDQDNGDFREYNDTYAPSYPRPYFGWWDASGSAGGGIGRLYPWGGYDPSRPMTSQTGANNGNHDPRSLAGRTISHTGFFYEGYDGAILDSRQPNDRMLFDTTGSLLSSSSTATYPLWRTGDPRPLINAAWQDYMIVFRPDGTVFTDWMRLRHGCAIEYGSTGNLVYDPCLYGSALVLPPAMPAGKIHMMQLGPGDMCNRMGSTSGPSAEATSFASRSGFHYISLAPDVASDNDVFPNVGMAMRSILPLYRVGVSAFGEVVVLRVGTSKPAGKVYDTALTGAKWNVKAQTDAYYRDHMLVNTPGYTRRGTPISNVVTPEMVTSRMWWWQ